MPALEQKPEHLEAPLDESEGLGHNCPADAGTILPGFESGGLFALTAAHGFVSVFSYNQPSKQLAHCLLRKHQTRQPIVETKGIDRKIKKG